MSKLVKKLISDDLEKRFGAIDDAVFIDYAGLTAEETREFRDHLRSVGASISVVKNTLVRRVFQSRGLEIEPGAFLGPTAIVSGAEDVVTASKAVAEWGKKAGKSFEFKAGLLEGKPLGQSEAAQLEKMPSAQEVRQMAVSAIAGPLTGMVSVVSNTLLSFLTEKSGKMELITEIIYVQTVYH